MNRLKGHIAYLCGSMDQGVPDRGVGWRKRLTPFLQNMGCGIFNPCDKPSELADEMTIVKEREECIANAKKYSDCPTIANQEYDKIRSTMREIVSIDLRMVDLSSFIILYIDRDYHACGTYTESSHGILQKKPILTMCQQGKNEIPYWLRGLIPHEMMFDNWKELKDYLTYINTSPNPKTFDRWKFFDYSKVYSNLTF